MANFLTLPIFKDIILPFVLVFVLVYAILEKSKLLGEDKHQINAIISFVLGGILIASFSTQIEWIKQLMGFLVIALVILFVFLLIYGFVYSGKEGFSVNENLKKFLVGIAFVAVVVVTLVITGYWKNVYDFFTSSDMGSNVIFIIVIIVALAAVLFTKKEK